MKALTLSHRIGMADNDSDRGTDTQSVSATGTHGFSIPAHLQQRRLEAVPLAVRHDDVEGHIVLRSCEDLIQAPPHPTSHQHTS